MPKRKPDGRSRLAAHRARARAAARARLRRAATPPRCRRRLLARLDTSLSRVAVGMELVDTIRGADFPDAQLAARAARRRGAAGRARAGDGGGALVGGRRPVGGALGAAARRRRGAGEEELPSPSCMASSAPPRESSRFSRRWRPAYEALQRRRAHLPRSLPRRCVGSGQRAGVQAVGALVPRRDARARTRRAAGDPRGQGARRPLRRHQPAHRRAQLRAPGQGRRRGRAGGGGDGDGDVVAAGLPSPALGQPAGRGDEPISTPAMPPARGSASARPGGRSRSRCCS